MTAVFINFIEEFWQGQIPNTTMGRIEVSHPEDIMYPSEEIRWGCWQSDEFETFRGKYDLQSVS